MKTKFRFLIASLVGALALCSCANQGEFGSNERLNSGYTRGDVSLTYNYADGTTEPPSAYNSYANLITGLELKELRAKFSDESGSFVFCPASSVLQLSLMANAASGDTKQEILIAEGGDLTTEYLNVCSSYFKSRMENVSRLGLKADEKIDETVSLGGALLADKDIDIKTAFLQTDTDFYGYDVFRYDFSGENAAEKLNNSFKEYTSDIDLAPSTNSAALISASRVVDNWLDGYSKSDIFKGSLNGVQTDFMRSNEALIKSDAATGIIKYTEKNPLMLVMIMPNEDTTLESYVKGFDNTEYFKLLESVDVTKKCTAEIPAFTVSSDGKAKSLNHILEKYGLYTLFTKDANLSSLSYTENLKLSGMYEIAPEFSISASGINSSQAIVKAESTVEKTDETIRFDRPFLFMLIDNESNIPVFAGAVK